MTTLVFANQPRKSLRLPEFTLVLGISVLGPIISLAVAFAGWTDGAIAAAY